MNCLLCPGKSCRTTVSCGAEKFSCESVLNKYHQKDEASIVRTAALLVDGGRAGELSRIQEVMEFAEVHGYKKVGLAYCYGMEKEAGMIRDMFLKRKIPCVGVSCTTGAMSQREVNSLSNLPGVSCNPISQAQQMMADNVDLAVAIGLCMGHDILFQKEFKGDQTTLVVKDRVHNHSPLEGISKARK